MVKKHPATHGVVLITMVNRVLAQLGEHYQFASTFKTTETRGTSKLNSTETVWTTDGSNQNAIYVAVFCWERPDPAMQFFFVLNEVSMCLEVCCCYIILYLA